MDLGALLTSQTLNMKSSLIRELVEMTRGVEGLISFAGGFPSPLTFPKQELAELFYRVIMEMGDDVLQYGASGGDRQIKEAIIEQENILLQPDEIHICNGATNGIFYALQTIMEPGDSLISEKPSFLGSLVVFEAMGGRIIPVSLDNEGLDTAELSAVINQLRQRKERVKFIYTIPDFQNPSGITMSRKRRESLIKTAIENNIMIIEDDPYSTLRYYGSKEESLFSLARNEFNNHQAVISIRSFSKILGPGLRIAYTLAHRDIIGYMNSWSQKINVTTDRVTQRVVAEYLKGNLLEDQIKKIIGIYRPLRDKMVSSLHKYMPEQVKWTEPEGGMFIWLTLPKGLNGDDLFSKALQEKVAYIPGSKFFPSGKEEYNCLRLNFSYPDEQQIEDGIKRLARVINTQLQQNERSDHGQSC